MSKTLIPLHVSDTSAFAKSLRTLLAAHQRLPSHLEMLNVVAKAAGHGNFQALRAVAEAPSDISRVDKREAEPASSETVDQKLIDRGCALFRCRPTPPSLAVQALGPNNGALDSLVANARIGGFVGAAG